MPSLGFSREVTDWYKSYLSSRKFHVNVYGEFSTPVDLQCGAPQGSILEALLFLLYINVMPQAVDCVLLLYADDTCLLFQHKDLEQIKGEFTKNFSKFSTKTQKGKLEPWKYNMGSSKSSNNQK